MGCFIVPTAATIRRTLGRLDAAALAAVLGAWLAGRDRHQRPPRRAVAVDGKTLRGACTAAPDGDGDGRPVHLLAWMNHAPGRCWPTPGRRRARGGARLAPLLEPLDVAGVVVTADALQTHPDAATLLVTATQAHDLVQVKANQPTLLARCAGLPWHRVPVLDRTADRGHGRLEVPPARPSPSATLGSPTPPRSSRSSVGERSVPGALGRSVGDGSR